MSRLTFVSYRQIFSFLLVAPAALLAFGYYLQFVEHLSPCPLCVSQRLAFYGVAISALVALITPQKMFLQHLWAAIAGLFALLGAGLASRQIWLQSLPADQVPACGPDFDFIIETFPLSEAISIMFRGNGNCAEVTWTFLSFSIPQWSILAFAAFALICIATLFKK